MAYEKGGAFDLWTILHTLWGVWLSWVVPFYQMLVLSSTWEIFEAYTKGIGETESVDNHLVDIIAVIFGYMIVIMSFSQYDIPWITARRGVDQCRCCASCNERNKPLWLRRSVDERGGVQVMTSDSSDDCVDQGLISDMP